MAKKTRKKSATRTPRSSKRASRDRFAHISVEIVRLIIAPRITALWAEGHRTPSALRTAYNERFTNGHGNISEAAFKDWLNELGFTRQPSTLTPPSLVPSDDQRDQGDQGDQSTPPSNRARPPIHLLRHNGDIDEIDNGELKPLLTPPDEALPGQPGYILGSGPSAR